MRICTRCVMDSSVPGIFYDDGGKCNFCKIHDERIEECPIEPDRKSLNSLVEKIKKDGEGKDYDCIMGISGGIDSTYAVIWPRNWVCDPWLSIWIMGGTQNYQITILKS